jgi:hypothetical protein
MPPAKNAVVIEKLDTPPNPISLTESPHSISDVAVKAPLIHVNKSEENINPPKLMIETEPAVHFTPYDTVFDENTSNISEIRYTPKISVEDKPPSSWGLEDDVPKLVIGGATSSTLQSDDIIDLDAPAVSFAPEIPSSSVDIDAPLSSTTDFEELS